MKRFYRSALALVLCAALLLAFPAAAKTAETDVFYPQLSSTAKSIYDAFHNPQVLECFRTGKNFDLTFNGPFSDAQATAEAIADAKTEAFAAFELDHPEMFWLLGNHVSINGDNSKLVMTVTLQFQYNWDVGGRSVSADSAALTEAVQQLAEEARAQGGVYEQLLYIHDWLILNNRYNSAAMAVEDKTNTNRLPWTPLGALTDVADPVCEGYASAFKLVCDELGIPCLLVIGYGWASNAWGQHAWNMVKLDGQWYAVDATYDDPTGSNASGPVSGNERREYFLVGAKTVTDGYYFSDTHYPNGEKLQGTYFTYPDLAENAYGGGYAEPGEPEWPEEPDYPDEPEEPDEPEWPDDPEEPEEPDLSTVFVRKEIPLTGTAVASTQTVTVGDEKVTLNAYALLDEKGNPTNYVRLRDLAALLNGTEAEFDVLWSKATGITIENCCPYDHPNGTEGNIPFAGDQPYTAYLEDTLVDGMALPLTAFQISWEGGSHTFYQLRDLGRALNFNVGWTRERGLFIEPDALYTDAD